MTCPHPSASRRRLLDGRASCLACGASGPTVAASIAPAFGQQTAPTPAPEPAPTPVRTLGESVLIVSVAGLSLDEAAIVKAAAEEVRNALLAGVPKYGHLRIDEDPRDWDQEAAEERRDLTVYRLAGQIRRQRASARRIG